ncbi:MAG: uroporphyrinogen decarboxylase [Rickettsia sp.]|nr:uroporphyrinogen decarboxylase [Rickettsia sp.]
MKKEFLKVFNGKNEKIAFWFMRQAGRYLPEYREIRQKKSSFLDLCFDVEKAHEVTLQPLRRFDMDAAIIFSDILILPYVLGWKLEFIADIGPVLNKFSSQEDLDKLSSKFSDDFQNVITLITRVKKSLKDTKTLIGFAGSPWTIASYMIEGRGKTDLSAIRKFAYQRADVFEKLIKFLTYQTIEYLSAQISAGADVIQIFESAAHFIPEEIFNSFIISPTKTIVSELKKRFPQIPIICFPKFAGNFYEAFAYGVKADAVSLDYLVSFDVAQNLQKDFVIQGFIDPAVLLTNKELIRFHFERILKNLDKKNFIFNLGGGVLPKTPLENLSFLVELIKKEGVF